MRRAGLACFLSSLALVSCSSESRPDPSEGPVGAAESAIAYGTLDTANPHSAVVALLAPASGGYSECTGTVVQVKNGVGYVLTAAHCCNMGAPTVVVTGSDYSQGVNAVLGGPVNPPAYAVTANSVYYDNKYNQQQYDFCMLKFTAPAGMPVIPVATPSDGLALGMTVEHVGYGVTDGSTNNTVRRTGTSKVDKGLDATTLTSSQGGAAKTPGVCEGDSGGPALIPAGVPQAQQKVVGTTSYGNSANCAQNTINVCMRVTSESGTGGFIANYLADTPSGTQAGSAAADCQTCANNSQNGSCKNQAAACAGDQKCLTLNNCVGNCTTQACITTCENTAGQTAVNELIAFDDCVCMTACPTECASECMSGSTSSSSSSSSSSTTSSGSASTSSGAGTSSSGSGTTSGGMGGSGAGASGTGANGAGGSGAGAGQGSGGHNNTSSGCSVAPDGSGNGAPLSLAGILLGAALAFSRRRR